MYKLVIGNKNYSSWSLRAWLYLRESRIPFEEIRVPLFTSPAWRTELARYTPAGRVPVLLDGDFRVWDSLAIFEYLREREPRAVGWPAEPRARAHARSVSAEMHSGFLAVRDELPQNIRACRPLPLSELSEACRDQIPPHRDDLAVLARRPRSGRPVALRRLLDRGRDVRPGGPPYRHLFHPARAGGPALRGPGARPRVGPGVEPPVRDRAREPPLHRRAPAGRGESPDPRLTGTLAAGTAKRRTGIANSSPKARETAMGSIHLARLPASKSRGRGHEGSLYGGSVVEDSVARIPLPRPAGSPER